MAMQVQLIKWTGSIYPMYQAAHTCRGNAMPKEVPTFKMETWLQEHVINPGHWSVLEFVDFHFLVTGISRACSHQLVRHRLASYEQLSQRHTDASHFPYVIPTSIAKYPSSQMMYINLMKEIRRLYTEFTVRYSDIPEEDARYILPNACETVINLKLNGRALIEASHKRLCGNAQWEIRKLFRLIQQTIDKEEVCPIIAQNMRPICRYLGRCPEGEPSCRRK